MTTASLPYLMSLTRPEDEMYSMYVLYLGAMTTTQIGRCTLCTLSGSDDHSIAPLPEDEMYSMHVLYLGTMTTTSLPYLLSLTGPGKKMYSMYFIEMYCMYFT